MSSRFYDRLKEKLQDFPGFISEATSTSIEHPDRDVFVATFKDEASADQWRRDPTHLRIQLTSREKIFIHYRIRVGPQIQPDSLLQVESSPITPVDRVLTLVEEGASNHESVTPRFQTSPEIETSISSVSTFKDEDRLTHLITWKSAEAAVEYARYCQRNPDLLVYFIRILRDYSKTSRDEAP